MKKDQISTETIDLQLLQDVEMLEISGGTAAEGWGYTIGYYVGFAIGTALGGVREVIKLVA